MAIQVKRATESRVCPSASVTTKSHFCSNGQPTALLRATYDYFSQSRVAGQESVVPTFSQLSIYKALPK